MALGDITVYDSGAFGYPGDVQYAVAAGAVSSILAGEPVAKALAAVAVTAAATNTPVVATDFYAGIAATTSTDTVALGGTVQVTKLTDGVSYLISPLAAIASQAAYDLLVGSRVLIDLTAGSYKLLAADGATNGCVILPLDVAIYPGKVRFSFRSGVSYLS